MREIHYRVGHKRGTIHVGADGRAIRPAGHERAALSGRHASLARLIWRGLPLLPAQAVVGVLLAAPAICLLLTVWLVYAVMSGT